MTHRTTSFGTKGDHSYARHSGTREDNPKTEEMTAVGKADESAGERKRNEDELKAKTYSQKNTFQKRGRGRRSRRNVKIRG